MNSLAEKLQLIIEGYTMNSASLSLDKARKYADAEFKKAGKNLDDELPEFDSGYKAMQKSSKRALNVPRIDMPVIEPGDMKAFDGSLKKGAVDVFKPYAKGKLFTPTSLDKDEADQWVTLGFSDGSKSDDKIKGKWTKIAAKDLIPTQSQIWLEKLVGNIIKFGKPGPGSPVLGTTIIVSKEGYILDGHHRYGQVMITDPDLKLKALHLPIDIKTLLKIGRTYGTAVGNKQKA